MSQGIDETKIHPDDIRTFRSKMEANQFGYLKAYDLHGSERMGKIKIEATKRITDADAVQLADGRLSWPLIGKELHLTGTARNAICWVPCMISELERLYALESLYMEERPRDDEVENYPEPDELTPSNSTRSGADWPSGPSM